MLLPALSSPLQPPLRHPTEPGGLTLSQVALSILRRPGLESHVYMPGVGWVSGFSLSNAIMEDGTQAASVDNPVGYMGDPVSTLGAELVTNGDFSVDANWTKGTGWTISGGVATHAAGASSDLTQAFSLTGGRSYQVSFTVSGYSGSGNIRPRFYGGTTSDGSVVSGNGVYSQVITANSGNSSFAITVVSTATCSIDNISVRELVGAIPARQATTANKPILRRGSVNRLLWSRDLRASTGSWFNTDTTVTKDQVGYDGIANGACLITQGSAGTATTGQNRTINAQALVYTDTWYLKRGNSDWVRLTNNTTTGDGGQCWVNLATGALGTVGVLGVGTGVSASVEDAGNGFWRVRLTAVPNGVGTTKVSQSIVVTGNASSARISGGTFIVDAVQGETGSTASPYIPTTTAPASSPTGPYWMEFDGTDFLSLAAVPFQQADDHCVIAGAQVDSLATARTVFGVSSTVSTSPPLVSLIEVTTGGLLQAIWRDDAASTLALINAGAISLGVPFLATTRKVGNQRVVRRNGGNQASDTRTISTSTVTAATLGMLVRSSNANFLQGAMYPAIVVKGTVTDAELGTLERWVASLSGVTL